MNKVNFFNDCKKIKEIDHSQKLKEKNFKKPNTPVSSHTAV